MYLRLQTIWFVLSLLLSLFLIFWGIPSVMTLSYTPQEIKVASTPPPAAKPEEIFLLPFSSPAIEIKRSGEEVTPSINQWGNPTRETFESRFGLPYEEAWKKQDPVSYPFLVPPSLKERVDFWVQVFAKYGKNEYLFHHPEEISVVYSVLDLNSLINDNMTEEEAQKIKDKALLDEKNHLRLVFKTLLEKNKNHLALDLNEQELDLKIRLAGLNLEDMVKDDAIRIQSGFAHKFREAIALSGNYMEEMENIFSAKGLPIELTRIPFIESAFNVQAYSSAKASGLWQFIPETGKKYLKIDNLVDERNDPILATYAAAEHLQKEYEMLGSWPLTVNAYNTGPGRMQKAMRQLGTEDIGEIIKKFKEAGYQFYSRNYYPEFLAALHVYDNREFYYGKIEKRPPILYDFFATETVVDLKALADNLGVEMGTLRELNTALNPAIFEGELLLPPGYLLRVPANMGGVFAHGALKQQELRGNMPWMLSQEGQTLQSIASQNGLNLDLLSNLNHYLPYAPLKAGMVVFLPLAQGALN